MSPDTIDHFAERFAPYGFRREAMMPVYGLAESTVSLCLPPVGRGPLVDVIHRDRFENDGIAEPVLSGSPPAGSQTASARSSASPLRFVSVGRAIKGHEVKIVDSQGQPAGERRQGRLLFRGLSITSGYFRNPQATAASLHDGWWDSGDYAYRADGEIYITGRTKDVIISGSENIYSAELEIPLDECPEIAEAAVVGRSDARWGEVPVACVVRRKGSSITKDQILALYNSRLAKYKHPHDVFFLDSLPHNVMGKVLKRDLREQFGYPIESKS